MNLKDKRILLTGATGGIGIPLAHELGAAGARLGLVGRNTEKLNGVVTELRKNGVSVLAIIADLSNTATLKDIRDNMVSTYGGIDVLINQAGSMTFDPFVELNPDRIRNVFETNTLAPILLTHQILPEMVKRGDGRIVNIGSTFGTIAFPFFATYSASKFALRGFSEALRRELQDTGVGVTYVSPRGVKTQFNPPGLYNIAGKLKMNMDDPGDIAKAIVRAIEKDRKDIYLGFPESFFARLNSILPRIVDRALGSQTRIMFDAHAAKEAHENTTGRR